MIATSHTGPILVIEDSAATMSGIAIQTTAATFLAADRLHHCPVFIGSPEPINLRWTDRPKRQKRYWESPLSKIGRRK